MASVSYDLATRADLDETAQQVEALGRKAFVAVVDVRDLAGMEALLAETVATLGGLDISAPMPGLVRQRQRWR
jgi:NAD(P)-dependent dehydrogenase (short-subunit alcohol dehydrogenase family)